MKETIALCCATAIAIVGLVIDGEVAAATAATIAAACTGVAGYKACSVKQAGCDDEA